MKLLTVGDLPVGNDVEHSPDVPQDGDPERHPLDRSVLARGLDHVAHSKLVLHEDEESRDDVLDQALRAERDGEPEDAPRGEEGPDREELAEGEESRDDEDHHATHTPDQLCDGMTAFLGGGHGGIVAVVHRVMIRLATRRTS